MRRHAASATSISVLVWYALLLTPSPAKTKATAELAEKPSLEVEENAQEAADRVDRSTDDAVRMLERVIIKSRGKPSDVKAPVNDSLLTAKTKLALVADARIKGRQVTVETQNGIITLNGSVHSGDAKTAAEVITKRVEGMKGVKNNLHIVAFAEPSIEAQDDAITDHVNAALKKDLKLKKAEIDIRTDAGIVTITGAVPDLFLSAQAAWAVWKVKGVRAVKNDLTLTNK